MTGTGRVPKDVLKVAATSKPVLVAGAIAGVIRTQSRVEIHTIGAASVNQAIKAIAISRGYVAPAGLDLDASRPSSTCRSMGRKGPGSDSWWRCADIVSLIRWAQPSGLKGTTSSGP